MTSNYLIFLGKLDYFNIGEVCKISKYDKSLIDLLNAYKFNKIGEDITPWIVAFTEIDDKDNSTLTLVSI